MDARPFAGCLLPNVPGDIVQHFRIGIIASLGWLLITQQIFSQIFLGDLELLLRVFVGALDHSVGLFDNDLLRSRLANGSVTWLFRHVLGELSSQYRSHTRHLVEAVEAVDGLAAVASSWGPRRRSLGKAIIAGVVEDLSELMEVFRASTCEMRVW
jgi:DNA-binding phage protein